MRASAPRWCVLAVILTMILAGESRGASPRKKAIRPGVESERTRGERLFLRAWTADDPRARGGDGLGPMFNARSCVGCHGLAGPGGGGANAVNVELLSAVPTRIIRRGSDDKPLDRLPLLALHPGFAQSNSIVLHRFGLAPGYPAWRARAPKALDRPPARSGNPSAAAIGFTGPFMQIAPEPPTQPDFRLVISQRNTPALFGAGLIDAIPDAAIEAEAKRQDGQRAHGRVSRLPGGRIGRFGWKAQVAGLEDFVLTACANEMGLEVPGHHQAADPRFHGERDRPGLDMAGDDCRLLVGYVAALPTPEERPSQFLERGRDLFGEVGCSDCHRPNLGGVEGLYSDLLVHDMGPNLTDAGVYYGQDDDSSPGVPKPPEWRTPPLWGVADSAPYLHDGRAATLGAAIRLHGGEAQVSVGRFDALRASEKAELLGFLRALKVPKSARFANHDIRLTAEEFLPFVPPAVPLAVLPNGG